MTSPQNLSFLFISTEFSRKTKRSAKLLEFQFIRSLSVLFFFCFLWFFLDDFLDKNGIGSFLDVLHGHGALVDWQVVEIVAVASDDCFDFFGKRHLKNSLFKESCDGGLFEVLGQLQIEPDYSLFWLCRVNAINQLKLNETLAYAAAAHFEKFFSFIKEKTKETVKNKSQRKGKSRESFEMVFLRRKGKG